MKTLVKEIIAYQYDELDEYAKEEAKKNCLEEEHLPDFFSEDLIVQLDDKFGLNNLKTYYSLSHRQGDGLCLHGKISHSEVFENDKFKKIALKGIHYKQIQSIYNELQGIDFEHQSRYYHERTVNIESHEYDPTEKQAEIIEKIVGNVKQWYFSFCREWEKRGYDYFDEMSDDEMEEICKEREYFFAEDGSFINENEYRELAV